MVPDSRPRGFKNFQWIKMPPTGQPALSRNTPMILLTCPCKAQPCTTHVSFRSWESDSPGKCCSLKVACPTWRFEKPQQRATRWKDLLRLRSTGSPAFEETARYTYTEPTGAELHRTAEPCTLHFWCKKSIRRRWGTVVPWQVPSRIFKQFAPFRKVCTSVPRLCKIHHILIWCTV